MPTIDRFDGIQAFMATAQLGSFTAAGAALGLTKSAVSKTVARLEARLATRLFFRTTRRMSLTTDGETFLQTCEAMTARIEAFEEGIGADAASVGGRVRIDLPGAFGRLHVLPILLDLMGRHVDLAITVSFTDRRIDMIEDGVDLAIRIGPAPDSLEIASRRIGVQTLAICASPRYVSEHGLPSTKESLGAHRLIVGRRNRTRPAWLLRKADGTSERHEVQGFHELADGEAMLAAAVAGMGIAQLPTWLAAEQFEAGTLVTLLDDLSGGEVPITLMWISGAPVSRRVRTVLEHVLERSATCSAMAGKP